MKINLLLKQCPLLQSITGTAKARKKLKKSLKSGHINFEDLHQHVKGKHRMTSILTKVSMFRSKRTASEVKHSDLYKVNPIHHDGHHDSHHDGEENYVVHEATFWYTPAGKTKMQLLVRDFYDFCNNRPGGSKGDNR